MASCRADPRAYPRRASSAPNVFVVAPQPWLLSRPRLWIGHAKLVYAPRFVNRADALTGDPSKPSRDISGVRGSRCGRSRTAQAEGGGARRHVVQMWCGGLLFMLIFLGVTHRANQASFDVCLKRTGQKYPAPCAARVVVCTSTPHNDSVHVGRNRPGPRHRTSPQQTAPVCTTVGYDPSFVGSSPEATRGVCASSALPGRIRGVDLLCSSEPRMHAPSACP